MRFIASFYDDGVVTERNIEADDIEDACGIVERDLRYVEQAKQRNSDCNTNAEWTCAISGDDHAECSLRAVKCEIDAAE